MNTPIEQQATATGTRQEQLAAWNGAAGHAWVEAQAVLDGMFKPMEDLLAAAVPRAGAASQVLDIGCGTGGTTLAVARRLGAGGRAVGIDISEPMVAAARRRAQAEGLAADFICADAQRHGFEGDGFDLLISRFGVMFFDEPVTALRRLRQASCDDAALLCVVWRGPQDNAFMTTAERAAMPLLAALPRPPALPARRPDEPGQFGWADPGLVRRILVGGGWTGVEIEPVDFECRFPVAELLRYITRMGPLGKVLLEVEEPARQEIIQAVRRAFDPYVHGDEVRYQAACWKVSARAGRPG